MSNKDIANKLLDTFDKTLNTIEQLLSSDNNEPVTAAAEEPQITKPTVTDNIMPMAKRWREVVNETRRSTQTRAKSANNTGRDRLITFREISRLLDYKVDRRSNIFNEAMGGPLTLRKNDSNVHCVSENQLCKLMNLEAPLDLNKQYYVSAATISENIGFEKNGLSPLNKPMSVMALDKRIPAKRLGGTGAGRGSWRFPAELVNTTINKVKSRLEWDATPEEIKTAFLREIGYYKTRGGR